MTERERWIVYPLLFLALGAALRDKLVERTTTKTIKCQELVIEDEPVGNQAPRVLAKIGRTEATPTAPAIGYFVVRGEVDVDGVVNARQYAYRSIPFVPLLQAVPGVVIPNVLQLPQQPGKPAVPAKQPKAQPPKKPPSSPATGEPAPAK